MLALPYEMLRDARAAFSAALQEFIGVHPVILLPEIAHRSPSAALLPAYRRITKVVRTLPAPARAREALTRRYILAMRTGKIERLAAIFAPLGGGGTLEAVVSGGLTEMLKGRCRARSSRPLFRRFERDYFES